MCGGFDIACGLTDDTVLALCKKISVLEDAVADLSINALQSGDLLVDQNDDDCECPTVSRYVKVDDGAFTYSHFRHGGDWN